MSAAASLSMNYGAIRVLKPNVTREEALRAFSGVGLLALYWRARRGPLRRIADIYVPYRVYRVNYKLRTGERSTLFAIDAVDGSLDLFVLPKVPGQSELMMMRTRNHLAGSLEGARLEQLLRGKVLRAIFQQGFFKVSEPELEMHAEAGEFYIPYWVAFYGNERAHCRVMNAIRRRIEGSKAAALFEEWLAA